MKYWLGDMAMLSETHIDYILFFLKQIHNINSLLSSMKINAPVHKMLKNTLTCPTKINKAKKGQQTEGSQNIELS